MWGAIAAVGQKVIGKEKEEWAQQQAQAGSIAQGMMGQSQQQLAGMNNFDYSQIPSYQDFTSFK